jgi:F420-dependent oxidoreductase-like protein
VYVDIVRLALSRQRVKYDGEHYTLPLPDGPGKALTLTVHPVREQIPIYLAAVGPKNLELCGEIAEGWLAIFYSPEDSGESFEAVKAGRTKAGKTMDGFDVVPTVPVVIGDDIDACADAVRPYCALYVGGMGSREKNFYNALATRMGYGEQAKEIQDKYLSKDYAGAAAAVPREFIERTSLVGPMSAVTDRLQAYAESGVTTLSVASYMGDLEQRKQMLRDMVAAVEKAGLAE